MGTVGSLRDVPGAFKRCSPGASRHRVNGNFERSVEPSFSRQRLNCAHMSFREEWPWELKEKKARKKRHFGQVSEPRASARAPSSVTRSYVVASTTAGVSRKNTQRHCVARMKIHGSLVKSCFGRGQKSKNITEKYMLFLKMCETFNEIV